MNRHKVHAHDDQRGMTLIEILVVVVIMAILASLAVVSIGVLGTDSEIESESGRLADGIALLQEQAQLEGRDYGLRIETSGYRFFRFDGFTQRWIEVTDDPALQSRELPPGLAFELVIEGRPVLLRQEQRPELVRPQLTAYGSGDMSPYGLTLVRKDAGRITLNGAADGSIEIERDDEP